MPQKKKMDEKLLVDRIMKVSKDGKIACSQALKIAKEEDVSSKEIGELLNKIKVKIINCQLGCFP